MRKELRSMKPKWVGIISLAGTALCIAAELIEGASKCKKLKNTIDEDKSTKQRES